jgi:hypothetical protein
MIMRILWGLGKFTVKNIVVPIAITAVTAVVLEKLADRVAPKEETNGSSSSSGRPSRASMAV